MSYVDVCLPEQGEGHCEQHQQQGNSNGRHHVLGVAGVDLVRGGVVPSHLHLRPDNRDTTSLITMAIHLIIVSLPRQHQFEIHSPCHLGDVDSEPRLWDDHAEVHRGQPGVGVGDVGHNRVVHHHPVNNNGS